MNGKQFQHSIKIRSNSNTSDDYWIERTLSLEREIKLDIRLLRFFFNLRNWSVRSISVKAIKLNSYVCSNLSAYINCFSMYEENVLHECFSIVANSNIRCGSHLHKKTMSSVFISVFECYSKDFPNEFCSQLIRNYV